MCRRARTRGRATDLRGQGLVLEGMSRGGLIIYNWAAEKRKPRMLIHNMVLFVIFLGLYGLLIYNLVRSFTRCAGGYCPGAYTNGLACAIR